MIEEGKFEEVFEIIENSHESRMRDSQLLIMKSILQIYMHEKEDNNINYKPFTTNKVKWSKLYNEYREIKYLLRRIERGYTNNDVVKELLQLIYKGQISPWTLMVIITKMIDATSTLDVSSYEFFLQSYRGTCIVVWLMIQCQ